MHVQVPDHRESWSDHARQYAIMARQYTGAAITEEEPGRITHVLRNDHATPKGDFRDLANVIAAGLSAGGTQHYVAVFDVPGSTLVNRGLVASQKAAMRDSTLAVIWK